VVVFSVVVLHHSCSVHANAHNNIFEFGSGGIFGFVADDKVQFYEWNDQTRTLDTSRIPGLFLPDGYRSVFGLSNAVGVIFDDKIHFYQIDNRETNPWNANPILNFSLPNEHGQVFRHGDLSIGIVINNKIHFYNWDWESDLSHLDLPPGIRHRLWSDWESGSWESVPYLEFSLPDEYEYIVGIQYGFLGVVIGGRGQFYEFNRGNNSWEIIPYLELLLPNGYSRIFGFNTFWELVIGAVVGDEIQFFQKDWEREKWVDIAE